MGKKQKSKGAKRQKLPPFQAGVPKSVRKAARKFEQSGRPLAERSSKGLAAACAILRGAPTRDDLAALEGALEVFAERSESASVLSRDLLARALELRDAMNEPARALARHFGDSPGSLCMARALDHLAKAEPCEDEALARFVREALRDKDGNLDLDEDTQAALRAAVALAAARSPEHPLGPKASQEFARLYKEGSLHAHGNRELARQIAVAIQRPIFSDPAAMLDIRLGALADVREDAAEALNDATLAFLDARDSEGWKIPDQTPWSSSGSSRDNPWLNFLANAIDDLSEEACSRLARALHDDVGPFPAEFLRRALQQVDKPRRKRVLAALLAIPDVVRWTSPRGKPLAAFVNDAIDDSRASRCEPDHPEQAGKLFSALVQAGMDPLDIARAVDPSKAAAHWSVTSAIEDRQLRQDVQAQVKARTGGSRL